MTVELRAAATRARITFAALTVERGLEEAASRASWTTHEQLTAITDGQVTITVDGVTRFAGALERNDGDPANGFDCVARSNAIQLDRRDALGNERFRSTTLASLAGELARAAGVEVGDIPVRRVNAFRLRRGENYREALQRLAEVHEVVITDDAAGRLRIFELGQVVPRATWRDGRGDVTDPIRLGLDYGEWRREWVCRGVSLIAAADAAEGASDRTIAIDAVVANTRPSRRVLANRAATSRATATAMLQWRAKQQLARTASVIVVRSTWDTEPGGVVRVVSPGQGIDDTMVVAGVEADLTAQRFVYACVFPDVYRPQRALPPDLASRPLSWRQLRALRIKGTFA